MTILQFIANPDCGCEGRSEVRPDALSGFESQGRQVVRFEAQTHPAFVRSLPDADGLICLPADRHVRPTGAFFEFQPFCKI